MHEKQTLNFHNAFTPCVFQICCIAEGGAEEEIDAVYVKPELDVCGAVEFALIFERVNGLVSQLLGKRNPLCEITNLKGELTS